MCIILIINKEPSRKLIFDLENPNVLRRTLAIAALNALSSSCWDKMAELPYKIVNGRDAFDDAAVPAQGKTVVIGALVPMLKKLLAANADFKVLETDSRTLKGRELGGIRVTRPDETLDLIAEAGSGYHFFGKSAERIVLVQS